MSIACLVIPSVLVVAPDHALGAASVSFGQNLIQNPGAEGGPPGQTIPFWTATGPFAVDRYSDSSGDLSVTSPGPRDRGNNYFWGGHANTVSSGTQTINLSDLATDITSGGVEYQLSGWLGGYDSQNDNAVLDAAFLNAQGAVLTDAILNGPDANARGGTSELLYKHTEGYVPAGAAAVRITITMRRTDGSDNDGLG
ncbi:MAG TPA: hypothetical protein VFB34_12055, partial [Chloroflexota bacterium]|nr:hypothetical protein [Chloroflexota bacterium]